jgi:hypothetical protein
LQRDIAAGAVYATLDLLEHSRVDHGHEAVLVDGTDRQLRRL